MTVGLAPPGPPVPVGVPVKLRKGSRKSTLPPISAHTPIPEAMRLRVGEKLSDMFDILGSPLGPVLNQLLPKAPVNATQVRFHDELRRRRAVE